MKKYTILLTAVLRALGMTADPVATAEKKRQELKNEIDEFFGDNRYNKDWLIEHEAEIDALLKKCNETYEEYQIKKHLNESMPAMCICNILSATQHMIAMEKELRRLEGR